MNEFDYIKKYIYPLDNDNSIGDDAATINLQNSLVITKDILVERVHFLENTNSKLLAKKALRVNLSDIAAMGAIPYGYFLGLILPRTISPTWWQNFTSGLKEDNKEYNIKLLGGDTTSNLDNTIIITITAIGTKDTNILCRSGAQVGDFIYVSGTIGDAALGLLSYQNVIQSDDYLKSRYDLPLPKISLGKALNTIASSCIDVSDGLIQDLEHICVASNVGAKIYLKDIPISSVTETIIRTNSHYIDFILSGGDDYELLFTISRDKISLLKEISKNLKIKLTRIGEITSNSQVLVINKKNTIIKYKRKGFTHFM